MLQPLSKTQHFDVDDIREPDFGIQWESQNTADKSGQSADILKTAGGVY